MNTTFDMLPPRIQRFEVVAHLGTGGMGTVYRARDPQLQRDVAIKVLRHARAGAARAPSCDDTIDLRSDKPDSSDELLREARLMARLSHPNVVPVYEAGLVDESVFVVMEHICGDDLATWLEKPRSTNQILDVFAQAAAGLAAAHARGIVHRDFKPGNVLVGSDGRVRVADFGLSLAPGRIEMVRVADGRGTPRYMAPELWRGEQATKASDVYAFCRSLEDALGDRATSRRLRAVIRAGLAPDAPERCQLEELIIVLEQRVAHRTPVVTAGAARVPRSRAAAQWSRCGRARSHARRSSCSA